VKCIAWNLDGPSFVELDEKTKINKNLEMEIDTTNV
jgi:hypothetical protein